jgi:hydrogenase small subunit
MFRRAPLGQTGARLSSSGVSLYGRTVRALRSFTRASLNKEPEWRRR